jgi:probable rRNA maturation factor
MIHLTNEQRAVRIPVARVRRLAAQIIGRRNLRKINRRFLNHNFATDVISFPLHSDLFGELVISAEYAKAEAAKRRIPVEEELLRYVAHGILHLLGYDDHRPADRRRMWARQERELGRLLRPPRLR